jgi:hypothetical protein
MRVLDALGCTGDAMAATHFDAGNKDQTTAPQWKKDHYHRISLKCEQG